MQRVAVSLFRYVPADQVTKEDMANNRPDPALMAKTLSALLGELDAFLTHSWHDDPEVKWENLQRWREDFIAKNGREPKLWIDKFCIDVSIPYAHACSFNHQGR